MAPLPFDDRDLPTVAPAWGEITSLEDYLARTRSLPGPYKITALGHEIIVVPPHVMSPAFSAASHFVAEVFRDQLQEGDRVLDVGCGCGILSILAGKFGAAHVTAVDINPHAVENTRLNFEFHGIQGEAWTGDTYDPIKEPRQTFDLIVFHAPFGSETPRDPLEAGALDPGHRALGRVIGEAHAHLSERGWLIIGFRETFSDLDLLNGLVQGSLLREVTRVRKAFFGRTYVCVILAR